MKYDFITIGGATEDIYLEAASGTADSKKYKNLVCSRLDSKTVVKKANFYFGGGAANAAVNFSVLGFKAAALIRVGADERGREIIKNLRRKKVDTSLVQSDKKEKSGFSIFLFGVDNEHAIFTYRGANDNFHIGETDLKNLNKAEWIYVASLSGKWQNIISAIANVKKAKVAWNPGSIQIKAGYDKLSPFVRKTDVLIMNRDEALSLAMTYNKRNDKRQELAVNTKKLLRLLKSFGPKVMLITEGKNGAYAYDGKKVYYQPALSGRQVIDTTGAGDAFGSGFVAGLKKYRGRLRPALKLAAKNAAAEVGKRGAQNRINIPIIADHK